MSLSDWGNLSSIGSLAITCFGLWKIWPMLREWKLKTDAWKFYIARRIEAGHDIYSKGWDLRPGSREFELAEYLVDQGKMFRREMGIYGLWAPPEGRGDAI